MRQKRAEVIIVGGGLAGLSAAIYLGRARRDTLVVDTAKSMARWEPDVQNYLGFPSGISGAELLRRGRRQAGRYGVGFLNDRVIEAARQMGGFTLNGERNSYRAARVLLATGTFLARDAFLFRKGFCMCHAVCSPFHPAPGRDVKASSQTPA